MRYLLPVLFLLMSFAPASWADCSDPPGPAGTMDYFGAPENVFKFCNGVEWVEMGGGAGGSLDDFLTYIKHEIPYTTVNALCPAGSRVIQAARTMNGKTGNEICASDIASDTPHRTCKAVKFYFLLVNNAWTGGGYAPNDKACHENVTGIWPWALTPQANSSRPNEWVSNSWAVCCAP